MAVRCELFNAGVQRGGTVDETCVCVCVCVFSLFSFGVIDLVK